MEKPKIIQDLGIMYAREDSHKKRHFAIFKCPFCSNTFKTDISLVNSGNTNSCGCYHKKRTSESNTKHGGSGTRIFKTYKSMKRRCKNETDKASKYYAKAGISVCDEWKNDFVSFRDWAVANGYNDSLLIDRINVNLGYSPENCRWVDSSTSNQNKHLLISTNSTGYRGVYPTFQKTPWHVIITHQNITYRLGRFNTKEAAALAYNNFVIEHHTHHPLNIINN